ncbi:MAG: hypothetical protein U0414_22040 [Polyangiaceae bacterium]
MRADHAPEVIAARRALGATAVALALSACTTPDPPDSSSSSSSGSGAPTWLDAPTEDPPALLSGVGLESGDATRAYTPRYPLYSDGLGKRRVLHLPKGARIDASAPNWTFPVGTVFAKTFVDGETNVETRLLFRLADSWQYAVYVWREDGSDADLLTGNWASVPLTTPTGVTHDVPSRLDCRSCHETHQEIAGHPVLGVDALQVDDALAQSDAFAAPPSLGVVEGRTPEETAALGYFVGNCVSCHTGGKATNASFSLAPADAVTETVNVPTESETGVGVRVVPGDPEASVLFIAVVSARKPGYDGPFKAMPPIGWKHLDPSVEAPLRAWIEGL